MQYKKVNTVEQAIEQLLKLRKATKIVRSGDGSREQYEVDDESYTDVELIKLANSPVPETWHR
jgi:hypothetical protein